VKIWKKWIVILIGVLIFASGCVQSPTTTESMSTPTTTSPTSSSQTQSKTTSTFSPSETTTVTSSTVPSSTSTTSPSQKPGIDFSSYKKGEILQNWINIFYTHVVYVTDLLPALKGEAFKKKNVNAYDSLTVEPIRVD